MHREKVEYVIFVGRDDEEVMHTAPVTGRDRDYFLEGIVPVLRLLTDDEYMSGPAVILHTLARYSYILFAKSLYWCTEWEPGLVVVRFSPDGTMAGAAFRSPIPDFGNRKPMAQDLRNYDEDAENHQYNLVFNAWDAQFDKDERRWMKFKPAGPRTQKAHQAALAHVDALGEQMEALYSGKRSLARWAAQCKRNLKKWAGEGIRLRL